MISTQLTFVQMLQRVVHLGCSPQVPTCCTCKTSRSLNIHDSLDIQNLTNGSNFCSLTLLPILSISLGTPSVPMEKTDQIPFPTFLDDIFY